MNIFLIRRGETTGDIEERYSGKNDDHLTPKGILQVQALGDLLENKNIEVLFSSPNIRAQESAKILARKISCPNRVLDDIRERNSYGILSGLTKEEGLTKYPDEVAKLEIEELHHNISNSETYEDFKKRTLAILEKIMLDRKYETLAIMTHGGVIRCFVRENLQLGELKHLGECSYIEIENTDGKLRVKSLHNAEI